MNIEKHMLAFLLEYREFARVSGVVGFTFGEHNPSKFSPSYGLCNALDQYVFHRRDIFDSSYLTVLDAMATHLSNRIRVDVSLGTDSVMAYPFGMADYRLRRDAGTQHECPIRLAFVARYIEHLLISQLLDDECASV